MASKHDKIHNIFNFCVMVGIDGFDITAIFERKTKDSIFGRRSCWAVLWNYFFDYDLMAIINVSNLITKVMLWFVLILSMLHHRMKHTIFHVILKPRIAHIRPVVGRYNHSPVNSIIFFSNRHATQTIIIMVFIT